ncbi:maleylpyruvate isomerase N-terminal domain-containing protein [Iamia sp.]|uniref:maleylpyruvate isomerase N-terminal domain-containing protein n=1 Tax=Iamia sp. TaxID=2722710 RepID=UPI002C506E56|nr:maleylpyruvate isomerase N-terminal domain-containing protein [Iamia sp.]HXH59680.1 maleylpyruvate isomerase N-terminal domain-containing protein [Iamia sp.]
MRLWDVPVEDPRGSLTDERRDLLDLLDGLSDTEWIAPTGAGHWRAKDVALHLLDDDLGWLSRGRDGDQSGLLSTAGSCREFVAALDARNERWVTGAGGSSKRVGVDLLRWSGEEVRRYYDSLDLTGPSRVIWIGRGDVPRWCDLARDLTERWVHQQHIRNAVGRHGNHSRFLPQVLRTFVWAFPHPYDARAPDQKIVVTDLGDRGAWTLTRRGDGWVLDAGGARSPAAVL